MLKHSTTWLKREDNALLRLACPSEPRHLEQIPWVISKGTDDLINRPRPQTAQSTHNPLAQ